MPYVLSHAVAGSEPLEAVEEEIVELPPQAAAVQSVTSTLAAALRALSMQGQTEEPGCTPCEKKRRQERLARLRRRS